MMAIASNIYLRDIAIKYIGYCTNLKLSSTDQTTGKKECFSRLSNQQCYQLVFVEAWIKSS